MGHSVRDSGHREVSNVPTPKRIKSVIVDSLPKREPERGWTMHDPYNFKQVLRNYRSEYYKLAWAQGVYSSPLRKSNNEANNGGVMKKSSNEKIVIKIKSGDDEEEGELEEGEVDISDSDASKWEYDKTGGNDELEQRIVAIRETLESATTSDCEVSFNDACFRLKHLFKSLPEFVLEDSGSDTEKLIKLAYGALSTLNNMFGSMKQNQQEQSKHSLSRLLCEVTSQNPPILSRDQIKEIMSTVKSLESDSRWPSSGDMTKRNIDIKNEEKIPKDLTEVQTSSLEGRVLLLEENVKQSRYENDSNDHKRIETTSLGNKKQNKIENDDNSKTSKEFTKRETSSFESRGLLEDTNKQNKIKTKDQNEDRLPSPAQDDMDIDESNGVFISISTYHQIIGKTSFNTNNLTSSSPLSESDNRVDNIVRSVSTPIVPQLNVSSSSEIDICGSKAVKSGKNTVPMKSLANSRDPRLRIATDELSPKGSTFKRLKNNPTGTSADDTNLLKSIPKEFNVNPAVLKNLMKMDENNNSSSFLENMKTFHLKSRDPRRELYNETFKKVAMSGYEENRNFKSITNTLSVSQDLKPINNEKVTSSSHKEVYVAPSPSRNTFGDVEHLLKGLEEKQKAFVRKERNRRIEEQKNMFAARKLSLVLDLDHTLLNSVMFSEVDPKHDEKLRKREEKERKNPHGQLFRIRHMGMWTKLRPGIWNFLEKASKLFELHICTMGNKMYATEMAKILDPKGTLFCGRVISKGADDTKPGISKTKDLEGVLGMESCVVIIDDTVQVWPQYKNNLIAIERYIYFPCSRRQFGLSGPSLFEIGCDESQEDGTLASSLVVIERIHRYFFGHKSLEEVDIRDILAAEKWKILVGCRIVFSGIFPIGEANPHQHPLWQTAEQLGAICTNQLDEEVTHVVAKSIGTQKVKWASSKGRFVVTPGWVEASALLYRRANEKDFALKSQNNHNFF